MPILRRVRLIAAIVLICAIFLPLSECSKQPINSHPFGKSISERLFPRTNGDFSYQYGYEYVDLSIGGALAVLAFTWPLIFALFFRRRFRSRLRLFLQVLEVLLCAGTIYVIHALAFGDRWLYGLYVGVAAVAAFTCAGLASWFIDTRHGAKEGG